jgi:hypothetical protein
MGRKQGDIKEIRPSTKVIIYCTALPHKEI